MISGSLAKRYAKALLSLASEEGNAGGVANALQELAAAVAEIDSDRIASGVLERDTLVRLGEALAAPLGRETTLGRFVRLLVERERLSILPAINDWFVRMQDEAAGRARLTVVSADELSDSELREVSDAFGRLAGCDIIPETKVDSGLIGGVVVELQGQVYDGSVKTHLARLAAKMAGE